MAQVSPVRDTAPQSKLGDEIGWGRVNHTPDIVWLKNAMHCLGRYNHSSDQDKGLDQALLEAVEGYQRDRGLRRDGCLKPMGETECTIRVELIRLGGH